MFANAVQMSRTAAWRTLGAQPHTTSEVLDNLNLQKAKPQRSETVNVIHPRGEPGRSAVTKFKGKSPLRHLAPDRKCRPEGKSPPALGKHKWAGLACVLFIAQCTYVVRRGSQSRLYAGTRADTDGLDRDGGC